MPYGHANLSSIPDDTAVQRALARSHAHIAAALTKLGEFDEAMEKGRAILVALKAESAGNGDLIKTLTADLKDFDTTIERLKRSGSAAPQSVQPEQAAP